MSNKPTRKGKREMKYEVYGSTKSGHLVHIINADDMAGAKERFLGAHPGARVTAVAIANGLSDPVFLFGDSKSAHIRTKGDIAEQAIAFGAA